MKNVFCLAFWVSVFAFAGCSSDELSEEVQHTTSNDVLVAYIPNARTTMNGKSVLWEKEDALSVFSVYQNGYVNNKYTLTKGAGSGTATFEGMLTGEKKFAFYPYNESSTCDAGKITYSMPNTYTYKENANSLAPMLGILNDNGGINFKNLCGLIKITIGNIPLGVNKVVLTSGGTNALAIAGNAEINIPTEGNVALAMSPAAGGKEISITFDATTDNTSAKTFYFPLPAGTYPELKFEVSDGNTKKEVKKVTGFTIERNDLKVTEVVFDKVNVEIPVTANSTEEVKQALENGSNTVEVANVSSETQNPTIELPKKENISTDGVVAISFVDVSTTKPIEVKEATGGTGTVAKNVRIAVPETTTSTPSVNVDLSSSTVSLGAVNAAATYDKVTASTADETLIVESGVVVNDLTINKGSVKIYGTVTKLTISSDSDTQRVLVYPGASCSNFTDNRQEGKIGLSYIPGDSGENENYTGGDVTHEWD